MPKSNSPLTTSFIALVAGTLLCLTAHLHAQLPIATLIAPDSSLLVNTGPRNDTLDTRTFLRYVTLLHPELRIADIQEYRAQAQLTAAWGLLDPQLTLRTATKHQEERFKNNDFSAALELPIYWGQTFKLGIRRSTEFFDRDYLTPEEGEPVAGISFPLWRNVLIDPRRASILKAEQGTLAGSATRILRRNALLLRALRDYWNWAGAYYKYQIARRLFDIGYERYQALRQEIAQGESPPIDSVEALQELMHRKGALVRARLALERATLEAAYHVWDVTTALRLYSSYAPEQLPLLRVPSVDSLEREIQRAYERRPELQRLQAEAELHQLDARLAGELTKPTLDIEFNVMPTLPLAFGGNPQSRLDYKVGVNLAVPILTRRGRGAELASLASASEQRHLLELTRRQIELDVRLAYYSLRASAEQVLLARTERQLAEQMAVAEQLLFQRGESDLFRLNFRERLLGEALEREIDAWIGYAQSEVFYRWARADFD